MIVRKPLHAVLALALACAPAFAQERPDSSDIIFSGTGGASQSAPSLAAVDLEKLDYLLKAELREKPFEELHSRAMAAFTAEGSAGNAAAVSAAAELAGLKATADRAYEEYLAALAEIKRLSGVDVQASGTGALQGELSPELARAATQASRNAARVTSLRAAYKQKANEAAGRVLAGK